MIRLLLPRQRLSAGGRGLRDPGRWRAFAVPPTPASRCYRSFARPLERPLDSALARRLIWNVVPAALLVGALYMTLAGKEGLLARHAHKARVAQTHARIEALEAENARKRARVEALRQDPIVLRRVAAEQLLVADAGATLWRFPEAASDE